MKLERFHKDDKKKRKLVMTIFVVACSIGVGLLLGKTFAMYQVNKGFEFVNGKVNYYGRADIYFEYYQDDKILNEMPQKGNSENLGFEKAICDNGATIKWSNTSWAPKVMGLTKARTKCMLYFNEKGDISKYVVPCGQNGTNAATCYKDNATHDTDNLAFDGTAENNLRYIGLQPNNYIDIGNGTYPEDVVKSIITLQSTEDEDAILEFKYDSMEICQMMEENITNPEWSSLPDGYKIFQLCHEEVTHKKGEPILWRIIGVMNNIKPSESGAGESRLKIIRDNDIGSLAWDTSDETVNGGSGVNEWSDADIMKLLNPNYSNNRGEKCTGEYYTEMTCEEDALVNNSLFWDSKNGTCYTLYNNKTLPCNYENIGLNSTAKSYIGEAYWNTGTFDKDGMELTSTEDTASGFYKAERSTNAGNICSKNDYDSDGCNDDVPRTTHWVGYIGLPYVSDHGFATGGDVREVCLNTQLRAYSYSFHPYVKNHCDDYNWLNGFGWTITPVNAFNESANVYFLEEILEFGGYLTEMTTGFGEDTSGVFPTAYLKSSVKITGGSGTKEDPYTVSL